MATPSGAEHRDLQQRFKDLEQKTRDLTTALGRRTSGIAFTGAEVAWIGAAPPVGTAQVSRTTTRTTATNASGRLTIALPDAFAHGLVAVQLTALTLSGAAVTVNPMTSGSSLSQVTVLVSDASGNVVVSTSVTVMCTAVGW